MENKDQSEQYRDLAATLRKTLRRVQQLHHAQETFLSHFGLHNVLKLDLQQRRIQILSSYFYIQFYLPSEHTALLHPQFVYQGHYAEDLEYFCLQDLLFWVGEQPAQHSLYLRHQVQKFLDLLRQQIFVLIDGREYLKEILLDLKQHHTALFQQLCAEVKHKGALAFDHAILDLLSDLCLLEPHQVEMVLPIQSLMQNYDELCGSAEKWLEPSVYRMVETGFAEHFCLQDLIDHEPDRHDLSRHALEQPALLGFVRLMNREFWSLPDVLAKRHFVEQQTTVWQKKVGVLPIFTEKRTVNWLFKQKPRVTDWVSHHIHHISTRIAVTALSYIDTQAYAAELIVEVLKYFEHTAARLWIQSCYDHAITHRWFEWDINGHLLLKNKHYDRDDQRTEIGPSILYVEEWLELLSRVAKLQPEAPKKVYTNLSRVMQAYLQHLERIAQNIPAPLWIYFSEEKQQYRSFYRDLQQYKWSVEAFRKKFYLTHTTLKVSVWDAYVRDYLPEYFKTHRIMSKHLTWYGLFQQAIIWHEQVHTQARLTALKQKLGQVTWQPVSSEQHYTMGSWVFQELKDIDQIIAESRRFQHCLAANFAERIILREYVAFHMQHHNIQRCLTLGCHYIAGQLQFDQLEYPNNQKASAEDIYSAECFIEQLNGVLAQPAKK